MIRFCSSCSSFWRSSLSSRSRITCRLVIRSSCRSIASPNCLLLRSSDDSSFICVAIRSSLLLPIARSSRSARSGSLFRNPSAIRYSPSSNRLYCRCKVSCDPDSDAGLPPSVPSAPSAPGVPSPAFAPAGSPAGSPAGGDCCPHAAVHPTPPARLAVRVRQVSARHTVLSNIGQAPSGKASVRPASGHSRDYFSPSISFFFRSNSVCFFSSSCPRITDRSISSTLL